MSSNIEQEDKNPAEILKYAIENYHHFCLEFMKALLDKYENTEFESACSLLGIIIFSILFFSNDYGDLAICDLAIS